MPTREALDTALHHLGSDRPTADERYEEIRARLIRLFRWRGFDDADELADETINRVAEKIASGVEIRADDPFRYFCGVTHLVFKEILRRERRERATLQAASLRAVGTEPDEEEFTHAFLHSHGIRVPARRLDPMVEEAIARLQGSLYRSDPESDLTEAEGEALHEGGFRPTPPPLSANDPLARSIAEFAALLKTSETVSETASHLGVEIRQVTDRLGERPPTLYGVRLESGWRLPQFQFDGERVLPGLGQVLAELDPELHPVAVQRWFVTPSPDLVAGDEETPLSPRDWLRFGLPAAEVARIAHEL